jgi:hypothetical protein
VKNKKLVFGLILVVAEVALILNMFYPAMSASQKGQHKKPVPSRGSVKGVNVGLYSDQVCITPVESIQWGLIEPGATANQTVYIRNEGDSNTTLTMTLSNWNPTNSSNYIGLNWDYTGQTLDISQVIQVRFTLFILENIQGITDFSFDVTIASN